MDASLEAVLRWWRVVGVSVQLCIHERNSCGRFSQLDEAKAAAGAVCSRQHEWKPEMRPGWNKSGLRSEKALMTGKARAPWQDAQSYRVKSKTSHHLAAYSHIETDGQTQILESCTKFDLMLKQAFCIPVFQPNPSCNYPLNETQDCKITSTISFMATTNVNWSWLRFKVVLWGLLLLIS